MSVRCHKERTIGTGLLGFRPGLSARCRLRLIRPLSCCCLRRGLTHKRTIINIYVQHSRRSTYLLRICLRTGHLLRRGILLHPLRGRSSSLCRGLLGRVGSLGRLLRGCCSSLGLLHCVHLRSGFLERLSSRGRLGDLICLLLNWLLASGVGILQWCFTLVHSRRPSWTKHQPH